MASMSRVVTISGSMPNGRSRRDFRSRHARSASVSATIEAAVDGAAPRSASSSVSRVAHTRAASA